MNNQSDIQAEKEIRDVIQNLGVHKAPQNFKESIIQTILYEQEVQESAIVYKPLISIRGWITIAAASVLFLGGIYIFSSKLSLPEKYTNAISKVPSFDMPSIQMDVHPYVVLGIAIALGLMTLQMPLLKKYYK